MTQTNQFIDIPRDGTKYKSSRWIGLFYSSCQTMLEEFYSPLMMVVRVRTKYAVKLKQTAFKIRKIEVKNEFERTASVDQVALFSLTQQKQPYNNFKKADVNSRKKIRFHLIRGTNYVTKKRQKLVQMVIQLQFPLAQSSKILEIKLSTAKLILATYKRFGTFSGIKKHNSSTPLQIDTKRPQIPSNSQKSQIQESREIGLIQPIQHSQSHSQTSGNEGISGFLPYYQPVYFLTFWDFNSI